MKSWSFEDLLDLLRLANITLFIGLVAFFILGIQTVDAKKFGGLKVHGDYRSLEPIISEIPRNKSGVTTDDVLERVRQKLWQSGIKPDRPHYKTHFMEVDFVILSGGNAFAVEVSLKKMAQAYGYDPREVGSVVKLPQGKYGVFGNAGRDKSYVLDAVDEVVEEFIADYKDSNLR
ncbi:MAG: hypothetical protein EBY48_05400 [Opitutae bacterium]|jgi:hypothetical protein|nr:hypothetical protein [Opitutae bacterium]